MSYLTLQIERHEFYKSVILKLVCFQITLNDI